MFVLINIKDNNEYKKYFIKLFQNNKILILKFFICFLNFFLLFINIYLIIKKIFSIIFSKFKNVDIFTLTLSKNSYKEISHYLNDKYFININKNSSKNIKKEILLDCVDFLDNNNTCRNIISNIFHNDLVFKIDIDKPDYLLYDVFGCEHLNPKYDNTIKIAYYSENIIPDFSETDYALSQAHLIYLDRYFKYPSFIWNLIYLINYNNQKIRKGIIKAPLRKKFCAAVISNNQSYSEFRLNFIKKLNKYKVVDMGGKVLNNIGKKVENKIEFLSNYKFSISMENSDGDGYVSEKIVESLIAGTIPIYYGDYMIDEYINPKAYILIKGQKDELSKIEYIKKIDNDDNLYRAILNEDIFLYNKNNNIVQIIEEEKKNFFFNIFYQEKSISKRIDRINNNNFKCLV